MIQGIVTGAPVWVWPLLVFLVWFGFRASRARETLAWPIYILPVLGLLSFNAVRGLDAGGLAWVMFAAGYLSGFGMGKRFQGRVLTGKSDGKVSLAGEWVTFAVLMVVFWMNFAGGVAQAISPELYGSTLFHAIFACVAGLAAGSFLGRALSMLRAPES